MNRPNVILAASAIGCVVAGGALVAVTEHLSFGSGICTSLATATTSGCPSGSGAAQAVAIGLMLVSIPLLGALFARLTAGHISSRVALHVAAAETRLKAHLEDRLRAHHKALVNGAVQPAAERMTQPGDTTTWPGGGTGNVDFGSRGKGGAG